MLHMGWTGVPPFCRSVSRIGRKCFLGVEPNRKLTLFAGVSTGHGPFALVGIVVVAACFDLGSRVTTY